MTRSEQLAVLGLAVLGGLVLFLYNTQEDQDADADDRARAQGAVEGVTWKAAYPPGHEHLALPWEIGRTLWGPHPLYCDRYGPGKFRDPLIALGWSDWIADPPSEATI